MRLGRFTSPLWDLDTYYTFTDGIRDQADTDWIDTIPDTGTVLAGDNRKGVWNLLPSDGSVADNDEAYLSNPNEVFLFLANKPIYGRCLLNYVEGNTDDANVIFGFMNAVVSANAILDDGGGPKSTGCHAVIYKVDGGTVWRCSSRNSTDYTDTVSVSTAGSSSSATYQLLEILIEHYTSTLAQVTYRLDGVALEDSTGTQITHTVPYASATEMVCFFGMKNGANSTVEQLNVDYAYGHQLR